MVAWPLGLRPGLDPSGRTGQSHNTLKPADDQEQSCFVGLDLSGCRCHVSISAANSCSQCPSLACTNMLFGFCDYALQAPCPRPSTTEFHSISLGPAGVMLNNVERRTTPRWLLRWGCTSTVLQLASTWPTTSWSFPLCPDFCSTWGWTNQQQAS